MKSRLNIFSDNKIKIFTTTFLSKYELKFMNLDSIDYKIPNIQANIIIIINDLEAGLIDFKKLDDNFLIITNLKNNKIDFGKKVKLLQTPASINYIKNTIENFIQTLKVNFQDISIDREKLINLNDKSYCYLTKLETEILVFLIREKETSKDFIKENILNIKSNIETNSLESHLTRIRKKMNRINTKVKIQTKNEKLIITF